jgi:hypothetical protein
MHTKEHDVEIIMSGGAGGYIYSNFRALQKPPPVVRCSTRQSSILVLYINLLN